MINFPFKKYLKTKYSEFLLFENSKKEGPSEARNRIINDIAAYGLMIIKNIIILIKIR